MTKTTNTGNTNILPHNPLKAAHPGFKPMEIFDHVKGLKGEEKGWFEFDLESLLKRFPEDKMLKQAYGDLMDGKKAAASDKETAAAKKAADKKAADAKAKAEKEAADKKAKADKEAADKKAAADAKDKKPGTGKGKKVEPPAPPANHGTSTKGRKTAAQMAAEKGKGAGSPATEQAPEETAAELADIK